MDKDKLLDLFEANLASSAKEILSKIWIPPYEAAKQIQKKLSQIPLLAPYFNEVMVSGETDNVSLYLIGNDEVLFYTPFMNFTRNVIFSELSPQVIAKHGDQLCLVKKNDNLAERLRLPKVLLVNPWLKEVLPSPQLNLSVASLASYLRKYQKAEVKIVDMQLGATIDDVVSELKSFSPDIFGLSVRFGYFYLCMEILARVISEPTNRGRPLIIAGGPTASLGYEEILRRFPEVLICSGEGERTMLDLAEYAKGIKKSLSEVSGIVYLKDGEIKRNPVIEIEMDDLPLPAMDTLPGLAENKGSLLAMETSRGCSYSACTFCPRVNMPRKWKAMSPSKVLWQLGYYEKAFANFHLEPTIYLADEDFIGRMSDNREAQRIEEIMEGINRNDFKIFFYSIDARVDQIYNPRQSKEWHIERMKMLNLCKEAISGFFLLGVESGSNKVLKRFNKRIEVNDSIMAIRILTSLGIDCRAAFINFDPLMDFEELRENVLLLERDDILLRPANLSKTSYAELFENIHDEGYIRENSLHRPLYEKTGFMTTELQVLIGSRYAELMKKAEQTYQKELFLSRIPDYDKAMYRVRFLDETIGDIALAYRKWFEKHWVLDGTLRGLMYTTAGDGRKRVEEFRTEYKRISFLFLKSLVWLFDKADILSLNDELGEIRKLRQLKEEVGIKERKEIILELLRLFEQRMHLLVDEIEEAMNRKIILENNLRRVINQWRKESAWPLAE